MKQDPDIKRLLDSLHEFINDQRDRLTRLQYESVKDMLNELENIINELEEKAYG